MTDSENCWITNDYMEQIELIDKKIKLKRTEFDFEEAPTEFKVEMRSLMSHRSTLQRQLDSHVVLEAKLNGQIKETTEEIQDRCLELHELSNLTRLGLVRIKVIPTAYINSHSIKNEREEDFLNLEDVEVSIDVDNERYLITELGELFVQTCNERTNN